MAFPVLSGSMEKEKEMYAIIRAEGDLDLTI
jgi:hypothetical protein